MEYLNYTNVSNQSNDHFLTRIDYSVRIFNFVVHLLYFVSLVFLKDLRSLPLIPMHHNQLIGLINSIHYCLWMIANKPTFQNETLNEVFCSLSETLWAISKYARAYSILTVAIYRYIGVTRLTLYKKIITLKYIIVSITLIWLIAAAIFLVAKYSSHTTHGSIYCYDGYSLNIEQNLLYYSLTSSFGYILPLILVILIYVFIQMKLVKLAKHLRNSQNGSSRTKISVIDFEESTRITKETKKVESNHMHKKFHAKERKLAHQFIIINILEFGSMLAFMLLSLNNIFPNLNMSFYFLRQSMRIINLLFQSAIPIASLIYHPHQDLNFCKPIQFFFCNKMCLFL